MLREDDRCADNNWKNKEYELEERYFPDTPDFPLSLWSKPWYIYYSNGMHYGLNMQYRRLGFCNKAVSEKSADPKNTVTTAFLRS